MSPLPSRPCTAFVDARLLAAGPLPEVAAAVKAALDADPAASILTFDDTTARVVDLDLRGTASEIAARFAGPATEESPRGRGRPRLGVVAREVTLLPRHWDWLATQPGGASQALRRLIDEARRAGEGQARTRLARERAYRFMAAMAGNLLGFEEATRALFAGDGARFEAQMAPWPQDLRDYALKLSAEA